MDLRFVARVIAVGVLSASLSCHRAEHRRAIPPAVAYDSYLRAGGFDPPSGKLTNPLNRNSQVVRDGEKLFSAMNCDGCHGAGALGWVGPSRSEEHTSELQSHVNLVCRLLLEKKKNTEAESAECHTA